VYFCKKNCRKYIICKRDNYKSDKVSFLEFNEITEKEGLQKPFETDTTLKTFEIYNAKEAGFDIKVSYKYYRLYMLLKSELDRQKSKMMEKTNG